jgi:hypothetical protein
VQQSAAGIAALALLVVVLGFWVPSIVKRRSELASARVHDRFSQGLRVLDPERRHPAKSGVALHPTLDEPLQEVLTMEAAPAIGRAPTSRGTVPASALRARPPARSAANAQRMAYLARRARRARRRLVLTILLVIATAGAWVAVPLTTLLWYGAAAPSALLVLVLVTGTVAAAAGRRADRQWVSQQHRAARWAALDVPAPAGLKPAIRPAAGITVIDTDMVDSAIVETGVISPEALAAMRGTPAAPAMSPEVVSPEVVSPESVSPGAPRSFAPAGSAAPDSATVASREPAASVTPDTEAIALDSAPIHLASGGLDWMQSVPLPTYVTKPAAPRWEPMPLTDATPAVFGSSAWPASPAQGLDGAADGGLTSWSLRATQDAALAATPAQDAAAVAEAAGLSVPEAAEELDENGQPRTHTLGLPLSQILARRRAV